MKQRKIIDELKVQIRDLNTKNNNSRANLVQVKQDKSRHQVIFEECVEEAIREAHERLLERKSVSPNNRKILLA